MTRHAVVAGCLLVGLAGHALAICTANVGGTPQTCPARSPVRPRYRITRDAYGVPHIKARGLYDVGYATGIAQAEDRAPRACRSTSTATTSAATATRSSCRA